MKLNVAGENKEYKEGLTVKELIALAMLLSSSTSWEVENNGIQ